MEMTRILISWNGLPDKQRFNVIKRTYALDHCLIDKIILDCRMNVLRVIRVQPRPAAPRFCQAKYRQQQQQLPSVVPQCRESPPRGLSGYALAFKSLLHIDGKGGLLARVIELVQPVDENRHIRLGPGSHHCREQSVLLRRPIEAAAEVIELGFIKARVAPEH